MDRGDTRYKIGKKKKKEGTEKKIKPCEEYVIPFSFVLIKNYWYSWEKILESLVCDFYLGNSWIKKEIVAM